MAKRKSKPLKKPARRVSGKVIALIATLALLLLAVLFYYVALPEIQRQAPQKGLGSLDEPLPFAKLGEQDKETLSSITVFHQWDGESYTLRYRDDKLYLEQPDGQQVAINEAYQEDILQVATDLSVEGTVTQSTQEVEQSLADMGLSPADILVTVTLTDASEYTLSFGGVVPDTTYHYYTWSRADGVYMADVGSYETFERTANMLLPIDQLMFTQSLIDRVTVKRPGQETLSLTFSTDAGGNLSAQLLSPIRYPAQQSAASELRTALGNLRLGTFQSALTAKNAASYGLETPQLELVVHQQAGMTSETDETGALIAVPLEARELKLSIGDAVGEYFYYAGYQGNCYYVSRFLVSSILSLSADGLATRAPADMGSMAVTSVIIQKGDTVLDVRIARTERVLDSGAVETDENGYKLYDVSATVNGKTLSEGDADLLIERLQSMTVSGNLPASFLLGTDAPRWQMTLTTASGVSRTIVGYPMDAMSDAVSVDGVTLHYINSEAILIAIGNLQEAAK